MSAFSTTRWSLVLDLNSGRADERARALEDLCATYWRPVYLHVRRKVRDPERAADLTQDFFAAIVAKGTMSSADPARGRFRTFLLTLLDNFQSNECARAGRLKRGGNIRFIPFDAVDDVVLDGTSDLGMDELVQAYDRDWARVIVDQAKEKVLQDYARRNQADLADALLPNLLDTTFDYRPLAASLDMSLNSLKVAVHRMRRRLGDAIRVIVRDTVATPEDVEAELTHLIAVLGSRRT